MHKPYGHVELEIQGTCNLKCVQCHQAFGIVPEDMPDSVVRRFYPLIEKSRTVVLQGGGEPLLNNNLPKYLRELKSQDFIWFATNGLLLTGEKAQMVLDNAPPLKMLSISLDASTTETYRKIRGADFEKVKRNILAFVAARNARGSSFPEIILNMTVMKENIGDLEGLIDLAAQCDKRVAIWPLQTNDKFGGKDWVVKSRDFTFVYDEQVISYEEFIALAERASAYGNEKGVIVSGDMRTSAEPEPVKNCKVVQESFMVRSNGDVFHCCHQTSPFMNWKYSESLPDEHHRHRTVNQMISENIIPFECSGSGCKYVSGAISPEAPKSNRPVNLIDRYEERKIGRSRK